jgi:hypothetical protein
MACTSHKASFVGNQIPHVLCSPTQARAVYHTQHNQIKSQWHITICTPDTIPYIRVWYYQMYHIRLPRTNYPTSVTAVTICSLVVEGMQHHSCPPYYHHVPMPAVVIAITTLVGFPIRPGTNPRSLANKAMMCNSSSSNHCCVSILKQKLFFIGSRMVAKGPNPACSMPTDFLTQIL